MVQPATGLTVKPLYLSGTNTTQLLIKWINGIGKFLSVFINGAEYVPSSTGDKYFSTSFDGISVDCFEIPGAMPAGKKFDVFVRTYETLPGQEPHADSAPASVTIPADMGQCSPPPSPAPHKGKK